MSKNIYLKEKNKKHHTIPSREYILSFLRKEKAPINKKKLIKILNVHKEQIKNLNRRLNAMELNSDVILTPNHCYLIPKKIKFLTGTVVGHRDGYGFLRTDEIKEDFYISSKEMKKCMHGDIVLAKILKNEKNKKDIKIVRIVKPRNNKIVGRYFINNENIQFVIPNDSRLHFKIFLLNTFQKKIEIGTIVVIFLKKRPTFYEQAIGEIYKILGKNVIKTNVAVNISMYSHGIPNIWPKKINNILKEIKHTSISEELKKGRIDLRHLPFITIDDEDSRDFDDAIYCEKKNFGWKLWVAISDVSYYVHPGTILDQEAMHRGNSVYFPSKVIPMLPEILSNELCSLNPETDRLCMMCEISINNTGSILNYKHYEAVICSHARLTYKITWKILKGDVHLRKKHNALIKYIENLYSMYKILLKKRKQRGGITFEKDEVKFILTDDFRIQYIEKLEQNHAYNLIEECMILANIVSAHFIKKNKATGLFRYHEEPSKKSVTELRILLKELKLTLLGGKKPKPKDYSMFLDKISNHTNRDIIQNILLRSMQRAIYSPDYSNHFGLSLKSYLHFTSPIRRYPDLIIHRIIKDLLKKNNIKSTGAYKYSLNYIKKLGIHCSMTERRADEATRDVSDWMKCDFMLNKMHEKFTGIIVNITNFGFFVRINNFLIDGLVHISTLNDDYYYFDTQKLRLIGESSKKIFFLGDVVHVQIASVNIDEKKINFYLCDKKK